MSIELTAGMTFGSVELVEIIKRPNRSGQFWKCACKCGNTTIKYAGHLRAGAVRSCGCVRGNNRTHGMSHSPEYKAWDNARSRCYRKKDRKYPLYGGRGITMCDAWRTSFDAFLADMGRRPSSQHSLDRKDSCGPYAPHNCRWATAEEQNNNRSINRHLALNGERVTVAQAARITGIPHATILSRLDAGKTDEEAIRNA